ncbi:MAG: hypothetical protein HRU43_03065 [Simkaniaceae bacterium]|nr:hypothetical protein [Simkaniaceae bacterium]
MDLTLSGPAPLILHPDAQRFEKEKEDCKTEKKTYEFFFGRSQWFNFPELPVPTKELAASLYDKVHAPMLMIKGLALTNTLLLEQLPDQELLRLGCSKPKTSDKGSVGIEIDASFKEYMKAFGSSAIRKNLKLPVPALVLPKDKPVDHRKKPSNKNPINTDVRHANAKKFLMTCLAVGTLAFVIKTVYANRESISASIGNWRAEWIDPYLAKGRPTEALSQA